MNRLFAPQLNKLPISYPDSKFLFRSNSGILPRDNVSFLDDILADDSLNYIFPWITTGSVSLIWAAMLGFTNIFLYGIDMVAVEIIPEATQIDPETLLLTEEPVSNPNYFIPNYLRKGETYFKPNITPQYHLKCWYIAKQYAYSRGVSVHNCNINSRLGIFPFCNNS